MIRFKKEDGSTYQNWKQFKLKEVAVYKKGFAFKAKDYKKEGVKIIRVSDLGYDYIKKTGQVCLSLDEKKEYLDWELKENDLIITTVGSKPPVYSSLVGKVIKVTKEFDGCLLNQNAIRVRTKEGYSQKFLYYVFSQKRYISFLESIMRGNANQGNITVEDLFGYEMFIPVIQEQERIADFLSSVDDIIQIQEDEISVLEEQKKGVMQKIFNREVRFKADDGSEYPEWEERLIGDILKICHGKDYKHLTTGDIPVLGTGGIITFVNEFLCDWECVLIGRKGTIDKPQYMNTPFWSVDTLFYSKPEKNQCVKFQYYLFEMINWKIYDESTGVPSLSASTIEKISVLTPCLEEQKKIANCLSAYDEAIQIKKDKLEVWKEIKKGLLQKMFV